MKRAIKKELLKLKGIGLNRNFVGKVEGSGVPPQYVNTWLQEGKSMMKNTLKNYK